MELGRTAGSKKPVGRSANWRTLIGAKWIKNAQVKIRYTHLEGQGPIKFRAGKKDQKKGKRDVTFFFLPTGKFTQNPVGRERPSSTWNSDGLIFL